MVIFKDIGWYQSALQYKSNPHHDCGQEQF